MKHPQSPWWWVPTLYFAEGIPYFIVNNISVTMFTKMGVPNGEMALFTSLLYLPWTIKPLWSPFVDIIKTKRWWILAMQLLMSAAFVLLTLTIPHPSAAVIASGHTPINLFTITLLLFIITAFASATHDIASRVSLLASAPRSIGSRRSSVKEFSCTSPEAWKRVAATSPCHGK